MPVDRLALLNRLASVGARRNHRLRRSVADGLTQCHCIVRLVGHHAARWHAVEQGARLRHVVKLAGTEPTLDETHDSVDHDVDLGTQST
jgi:hypothetical protein